MKPGLVRPKLPDAAGDPGVYVDLRELIALQHRARGFSFLPHQPLQSLLAGRHASRMRGRGLDFDEIRPYLAGDDIRSIDWNVTARTGKTHTRVFTEERDRPALLLVDQRIAMFWGTKHAMKSVIAAEAAALAAWRVIDQGDRVGALVFDDEDIVEIRPQRSRDTVMQILRTIVDKNHALRTGDGTKSNPAMLGRVLQAAARLAHHDALVAIISDFDGADDAAAKVVQRLNHTGDVLCALVHDPSALALPEDGRVVVSDGDLQVEVEGQASRRLAAFSKGRIERVLDWQRRPGVPVLALSTAEPAAGQLRRMLGAVPRPFRGRR